MNNISTIENLMFLAFCDETCNDVTVISRGNSSIYFKDRIDFRPETIMFGLHKMDDGRYALMLRGGGPCDYGLEDSDLTLEDVWQTE